MRLKIPDIGNDQAVIVNRGKSSGAFYFKGVNHEDMPQVWR